MDINQVAERYKRMNTSELLDVLQNPSHYQPIALELANKEIISRGLSESEIQEAGNELNVRKLIKEQQKLQLETTKAKVSQVGNTIYEGINPIQRSAPTAEKSIWLLVIVFGGLSIYSFIINFDLYTYIFSGDNDELSMTLFSVLPNVLEIMAVILFAKRNQSGWILFSVICCYSLLTILYGLFNSSIAWISESESLIYLPSPHTYLIAAIFYGGTFTVLQKQSIKSIYKIKRQDFIGSIVVGVLIGILLISINLMVTPAAT